MKVAIEKQLHTALLSFYCQNTYNNIVIGFYGLIKVDVSYRPEYSMLGCCVVSLFVSIIRIITLLIIWDLLMLHYLMLFYY